MDSTALAYDDFWRIEKEKSGKLHVVANQNNPNRSTVQIRRFVEEFIEIKQHMDDDEAYEF